MKTKPRKLAWVTGSKSTGYRLKIADDERTSHFFYMDGEVYKSYRLAQEMANAIHMYCKTK